MLLALPAGARAAELGPVLSGLADTADRAGAAAALDRARALGLVLREDDRGTWLPVIVEPTPAIGPRAVSADGARALGARLDATSRDYVRLLVPPERLRGLTALTGAERLRAPTIAIPDLGLGTNLSEAVTLTGADDFQTAGIDGSGVAVAVVDLGFIGLNSAIAAGELPADTVAVDYSGTGIESGTVHGVGVAEHVADMAPGATLHCIKVSDEVDLQNTADYLASQGIPIANHSVGWVNASYYDDTGPINDIFNASHDTDGVFWAVSAGNAARRHWRGGWADGDSDGKLDFTPGDDALQITTTSSSVSLFLNWDQYGAVATDLNLYVYTAGGTLVAASTADQTPPGKRTPPPPSEAVGFTYNDTVDPYYVEVRHVDGPTADLDITLFTFNNNVESYVTAASMMDPANAHGTYAVAAVRQSNWNDADPAPEWFSSQGPTTDGRLKPDIAAPDGTTSWTYGTTGSYGTSFSSPTLAGAAALLLAENPARSNVEIAAQLTAWAQDIGDAGPDPVFGAGKLHLEPDADGDGVSDASDNCPGTANPAQTDTDDDGQGDACDADDDGDGLSDDLEASIGTNPLLVDTDGDGLDDYAEVAWDGDDTAYTPGADLNPLSGDTDGDGIGDADDPLPLAYNHADGDLAPLGAPDGVVNAADVLIAQRIAGGDLTPTDLELTHGDVHPAGAPDGVISLPDVLAITRQALGAP